MTRILLFIGTGWAFGSVHSELVKYMHGRGVIADILDWSKGYGREEIAMMARYYDYFYGVPGETWPLTDNYGVPPEKIVVVAHGEYDLQHVVGTRPADEINRFAGYAVISEFLRDMSAVLGIPRVPSIVKYGVNCRRFHAPLPTELRIVGYGGSLHRADPAGVDWKRGHLAKQATEAVGLEFAPAGQFHFLAMPQYYRRVDAVLVSSLREGFGLPAMEAAAAGRLVISTPVGGFPDQAAHGAGLAAPMEPDAYRAFVTEKLELYKSHPGEYVEICGRIRDAARYLDWEYVIDDWIRLFTRR